MEKYWIFFYNNIYCIGAGIGNLMSTSDGLGSYFFRRNMGKNAAYEGKNGWRGVYFRPESASFVLVVITIISFFPICTPTWRVNNCISRQGESINRRKGVPLL